MTYKEKIYRQFEQMNARPHCAVCKEARRESGGGDVKHGSRSNMLLGFHTQQEFDALDVLVLAESHGGGRKESFYYPNKTVQEELSGLYHYYMDATIEKFHQQQMRELFKFLDVNDIKWLFTDLVKSYVSKRPEENFSAAIHHCSQYLNEQLNLYRPRKILSMGSYNYRYFASKYNLPPRAKHGDVFNLEPLGARLIHVTFPSAMTANHWAKAQGWEPIKEFLLS